MTRTHEIDLVTMRLTILCASRYKKNAPSFLEIDFAQTFSRKVYNMACCTIIDNILTAGTAAIAITILIINEMRTNQCRSHEMHGMDSKLYADNTIDDVLMNCTANDITPMWFTKMYNVLSCCQVDDNDT